MNAQHQPSILVVGPSWVGDMVMAQSLFKVLKQQRADCQIDVLAPAWSLPLLERMPEVRQGISMALQHGQLELSERWRLGESLRGQYQQAILLPNSWKSALVPYAAKIPVRTGWVGEMRYGLLNDARRLDKKRLPMTVQRFIALGVGRKAGFPDIPLPRLHVSVPDVAQAMQNMGLSKKAQQPILGLCPGAEYGEAKRWPEKHYAALAQHYLQQGWAVWLFGSGKDQAVCRRINTLCDNACVDLSGRTSLAQAVDLLSLANAVVSNDSGLMHVAAALNRPLVAVYGSSDPTFTPPLNARSKVVSLGLGCSPCFKRECPLGHLDCLEKLPVELVQKKLHKVV